MMRRDQDREPKTREGGFTLLEVITAIAILTFGLLAVATMQSTAIRGNFRGYRLTEATNLAQDRIEFLLTQPYSDAFLTEATGKADPIGGAPSGYTITYDVDDDDGGVNFKLITVNVQMPEGRVTTLNYIRPAIY